MDGPGTLAFWVNLAQIVSAIGTAGAVWVSLHLARRPERPRPKIFITLRDIRTIGLGDHDNRKLKVCIDIVNAGILPFTIRHGNLQLNNRRGQKEWAHGLMVRSIGAANGMLMPTTLYSTRLEHGQELSFSIDISAKEHWQRGTQSGGFFSRQRPIVTIMTSLGTSFKARMSRYDYLEIKNFVKSEAAENNLHQ